MTTVADVEKLCNAHDSGVYPQGLPKNYSWYKGTSASMNGGHPCPANWTACTAYWVIYPQDYTNRKWTGGGVYVKDLTCHVHKKTGGWIQVQAANLEQKCGRFDGPQTGNQAWGMTPQMQSDGSARWDAPPLGYCNHGWPGPRGGYAANQFDYAFASMKMKCDNAEMDFLGMAGMDWWQSGGAPFPNNMGSGACSWVKLYPDRWVELYATEMELSKFSADPPPGVTAGGVTPPVEPPVDPPPQPAPSGMSVEINGVAMKPGETVTIKMLAAQPKSGTYAASDLSDEEPPA